LLVKREGRKLFSSGGKRGADYGETTFSKQNNLVGGGFGEGGMKSNWADVNHKEKKKKKIRIGGIRCKIFI